MQRGAAPAIPEADFRRSELNHNRAKWNSFPNPISEWERRRPVDEALLDEVVRTHKRTHSRRSRVSGAPSSHRNSMPLHVLVHSRIWSTHVFRERPYIVESLGIFEPVTLAQLAIVRQHKFTDVI